MGRSRRWTTTFAECPADLGCCASPVPSRAGNAKHENTSPRIPEILTFIVSPLLTRDRHTKSDEGAAGAWIGAAAESGANVPRGVAEVPPTHHPERVCFEIRSVIRGVVGVGLIRAPGPLPDVATHIDDGVRAFRAGELASWRR